jgi:hypothetical protein
MLKAFKITCPTFSDELVIIKASQSSGKARYDTFRGCNQAGYNISIIEFRVIRAKEYDGLIKSDTSDNKTLGWKDTGWSDGCLYEKNSAYSQVLNPKSKQWVLIDTRRGVIVEYSDTKFEGVEVATKNEQ